MCSSKFQHAIGACSGTGHLHKVSALSGRSAVKQTPSSSSSFMIIPELGRDGKVHMESFLSLLHLHQGSASDQQKQCLKQEVPARSSPWKPAVVDPDIVEDWQLLSLFRDL